MFSVTNWFHGHQPLLQEEDAADLGNILMEERGSVIEMRDFSTHNLVGNSTDLLQNMTLPARSWNRIYMAVGGTFVVAAILASLAVGTIQKSFSAGHHDKNMEQALSASKSFLPEFTLNTIIKNATSPQAKAFAWLQDHPEFKNMHDWRKRQLMAIVSLIGPESAAVTYDNECGWSLKEDSFCTADGHYQALQAEFFGLKGRLPPEVSFLTALTSMNLFNNHLTGPLPTEVGELTTLCYLEAEKNALTGTVPSELGRLTSLTWLGLGYNSLNGTLPSELAKLTALTRLGLSDTSYLSGTIPSQVGELTSLEFLDLMDNLMLTGLIPSEVGRLSNLTELGLHGNQLNGVSPSELGHLTALKFLNFGNNAFNGTLPSELGKLYALKNLDLEHNQLTGPLPSELGKLSALTHLQLGGNRLSGTVPSELEKLTELAKCQLEDNQFNREIPSGLDCGI